MKKISIISMLSVLTLPAFAETNIATVDAKQGETNVVEQYSQQFEQPKVEHEIYYNSKTQFPHGLQIGLGLSPTSGLNAFVGYNNKNFDSFWWKRFGIRLDFATYSPVKSSLNSRINDYVGNDGIEIDKNLKVNNAAIDAKHFGAMIDFYPFGDTWFFGGWRLSGGYMTGNLDLSADIKGTKKLGKIEFELGDRKYVYDGNEMKGKANVNWKYSGPYLGTGFDLGIFRGFKLYFDAGVVFADNHAKVDLDVPLTGLKDITTNPLVPEEITGALLDEYNTAKAKALADAQKEIDKLDYYPLVKLGFMYRF